MAYNSSITSSGLLYQPLKTSWDDSKGSVAVKTAQLNCSPHYTRNINYYLTDFNFRDLIKL
eukprot:5740011-Amphidinium_carterae.1